MVLAIVAHYSPQRSIAIVNFTVKRVENNIEEGG